MAGKKLIVIGGGAAGFFCAVNAARMHPQMEVLLLERSSKLLSKVKVSGGGRCNVTHSCTGIAEMAGNYPRGASFLKKAFHHFFIPDTVRWFEERGVKLKTEPDGRMFPVSDNSQSIIDCLLNEAARYGVSIQMNVQVNAVNKTTHGWNIIAGNNTYTTGYLCIATGGFSSTGKFDWITTLGHTIKETVPSLFTFNCPGNAITGLMGISVSNIQVKIAGTKLQESGPVLITHWGLSGPAILKLSAWGARELASKQYVFNVLVNWLPGYNEITLKQKFQQLRFDIASKKIVNRNPFGLPARLWEFLLEQVAIHPEMRWADLPAKEQNKLVKILCAHEINVRGKTTFKEEFVTAGGVSLDEIDVNSMQSRINPGLFFAGEVIDVDGVTGGFNFQNAWTTGWIAAKAVGEGLQINKS